MGHNVPTRTNVGLHRQGKGGLDCSIMIKGRGEERYILARSSTASGERQVAISHNIFLFHATYYLSCLPAATTVQSSSMPQHLSLPVKLLF